jgi:hypothetical protein
MQDTSGSFMASVPALPEKIARFRTQRHEKVCEQSMECEKCAVCMRNYQLNEYYAIWPCTNRHIVHARCMLTTLRKQDLCPVCHC